MRLFLCNILILFLLTSASSQVRIWKVEVSVTALTAECVLTDSLGRRTGFEPSSDTRFEEIPNSSYTHEGMGDEEGHGPGVRASVLTLEKPFTGNFSLTVWGGRAEMEPFRLTVLMNRAEGGQSFSFAGVASRDHRIKYKLRYDLDTTKALMAVPTEGVGH